MKKPSCPTHWRTGFNVRVPKKKRSACHIPFCPLRSRGFRDPSCSLSVNVKHPHLSRHVQCVPTHLGAYRGYLVLKGEGAKNRGAIGALGDQMCIHSVVAARGSVSEFQALCFSPLCFTAFMRAWVFVFLIVALSPWYLIRSKP